jgi:hypothetical protein
MKEKAPELIREVLRNAVVNEIRNLLPEVLGTRTLTEILPKLLRRQIPCQKPCQCSGNRFPPVQQGAASCSPQGPSLPIRVARETNTPERFPPTPENGRFIELNNSAPPPGSFGREPNNMNHSSGPNNSGAGPGPNNDERNRPGYCLCNK